MSALTAFAWLLNRLVEGSWHFTRHLNAVQTSSKFNCVWAIKLIYLVFVRITSITMKFFGPFVIKWQPQSKPLEMNQSSLRLLNMMRIEIEFVADACNFRHFQPICMCAPLAVNTKGTSGCAFEATQHSEIDANCNWIGRAQWQPAGDYRYSGMMSVIGRTIILMDETCLTQIVNWKRCLTMDHYRRPLVTTDFMSIL